MFRLPALEIGVGADVAIIPAPLVGVWDTGGGISNGVLPADGTGV